MWFFAHSLESYYVVFLVPTANFQDLFGKYEREADVKMALVIHWWNIVGDLRTMGKRSKIDYEL